MSDDFLRLRARAWIQINVTFDDKPQDSSIIRLLEKAFIAGAQYGYADSTKRERDSFDSALIYEHQQDLYKK